MATGKCLARCFYSSANCLFKYRVTHAAVSRCPLSSGLVVLTGNRSDACRQRALRTDFADHSKSETFMKTWLPYVCRALLPKWLESEGSQRLLLVAVLSCW